MAVGVDRRPGVATDVQVAPASVLRIDAGATGRAR